MGNCYCKLPKFHGPSFQGHSTGQNLPKVKSTQDVLPPSKNRRSDQDADLKAIKCYQDVDLNQTGFATDVDVLKDASFAVDVDINQASFATDVDSNKMMGDATDVNIDQIRFAPHVNDVDLDDKMFGCKIPMPEYINNGKVEEQQFMKNGKGFGLKIPKFGFGPPPNSDNDIDKEFQIGFNDMKGQDDQQIGEKHTGFRLRMPEFGFGGGPRSLRNDHDKEFQNGVNIDDMKGHKQVGERQPGFRLRMLKFGFGGRPSSLRNEIDKEFIQNGVNVVQGNQNKASVNQTGFSLKMPKFHHHQQHNKAHKFTFSLNKPIT